MHLNAAGRRRPIRALLRQQRHGLVSGLLLVLIGSMLSLAVLYPQDILQAFSVAESDGLFPLLLLATLLGGCCFLIAGWWTLGWMARQRQGFRRLDAATQATVAVEFVLAVPILIYLFGTVFQMGEIAHAQLTFRYAAFSAARAGAVSDTLLPWPPRLSMQTDHHGNSLPMVYFIDEDDKARMRTAAAVAMAGIDAHKFSDHQVGLPGFWHQALAHHYFRAGQLSPVRRSGRNPWVDESDFFGRQLRNANLALVKFEPQCDYADLLGPNMSATLANQLNQMFNFGSISGGSGPLARIFNAIGFSPEQIIMSFLNSLIESVLKATGLYDFLLQIPNPLAPPMISLQMQYELRMRPASLFYLITPNGQNGRPCLTLRRTSNYKTRAPLLMQTSGGRIDLPVIPPLILYVNIFPGESYMRMGN